MDGEGEEYMFPISIEGPEILSAGCMYMPFANQRSGGTSKLGLVELAGIEPRSLVGLSLKLLSPTLAEGDHPPRTLPTKGEHPLRTPGRGFIQ